MSAYRFIVAEKANHSVARMCRALGYSRSSFYHWLGQPESTRRREDRRFATEVCAVFAESKRRYGQPRISRALRARGFRVSKKRVARLMRENGIRARRGRRFVTTTKAHPKRPAAPNLLQRNFEVTAPNTVWAGDITYIPTREGWLYLAVVIDLFSRLVVGWKLSKRIDSALAVGALEHALVMRRPPRGLLHHSDRGSQYTSDDYTKVVRANGITVSMSNKGDCFDNAVVESFFSSLKMELGIVHDAFNTRGQAHAEVGEYIEVFYNRQRLHSTLDYVSPMQYETLHRSPELMS